MTDINAADTAKVRGIVYTNSQMTNDDLVSVVCGFLPELNGLQPTDIWVDATLYTPPGNVLIYHVAINSNHLPQVEDVVICAWGVEFANDAVKLQIAREWISVHGNVPVYGADMGCCCRVPYTDGLMRVDVAVG